MRVGSLFSGIGGLDLGLERAGMSVVWQCEADPYCRAVLRKHWPNVPCYEDVRDITADAPVVDLLCGGFPCQPISSAGHRKGIHDDRWLWPEFARVIRLLRPPYVLMENVTGLLRPYEHPRGSEQWWPALIEAVLTDLAALSYDAEWDCIPAAAVGAPHVRDRVFLLAYADGERPIHREPSGLPAETGEPAQRDAGTGSSPRTLRRTPRVFSALAHTNNQGSCDGCSCETGGGVAKRGSSDVADTQSVGLQGSEEGIGCHTAKSDGRLGESARGGARGGALTGRPWVPEPDVGRVVDGVPSRLDSARIRGLGNAVVPQVAEWIGRRIMSAAACSSQGDEA